MKKSNLISLTLSSVLMLLLSSCGSEMKSESQNTTADAEHKSTEVAPEIIFENNYAKVAKVRLAPGEVQPAHAGNKRLIYSLTDYSIDWDEKGEKLGRKTWKKGDVHFHEAGKHAANNVGTTSAEWLVFSKKNTDLPDCGDNTEAKDVNSVSPDFTQILFDNDEFKVTRVNLPKGKSIPTHSGINRIIYALSDYGIKYQSDTKGKVDKKFKVGDTHWHEACMHSLENDGENNAEFLVINIK